MKFRPCIDIHNGKVKQIVGGSLMDANNQAIDNFVSEYDGSYYAAYYKGLGLTGGHIILLNNDKSEFYEADVAQAASALSVFGQGLQVGGGINADNANRFLSMGAAKVIVTSYVFADGEINYENLRKICDQIGKDKLVLDFSCRKKGDKYYIVTDRWQKFTNQELTVEFLLQMTNYCSEFLIHAVDVEGKASGIEVPLVKLLAKIDDFPITYAGGVGSMNDLELLKEYGENRIDVTVGSALDLFGGPLKFVELLKVCN